MIERISTTTSDPLEVNVPINSDSSFLLSSNPPSLSADTFRREWDNLPKSIDPKANIAVTRLFGEDGSADRFQYSESDIFTPGLTNVHGISGAYKDGKGFALINVNNISKAAAAYQSSSELGMSQNDFQSAIIANEIAGKIAATDPKYKKLDDTQRELISDAASMNVNKNFAFKTLATNSQYSTAQEAGNYSEIYKQTAKTFERTLNDNPSLKAALVSKLKDAGLDQNNIGEGAMKLFFQYASNAGGSIPDRFVGFTKDVLGTNDGVGFGEDFASNMRTDFNKKSNQFMNQ